MNQADYQPIHFMKYKWLYFALSGCVIIPGIISLGLFGLKPAIDFTGGSLLEIKSPVDHPIGSDMIRQSYPDGVSLASIQESGNHTLIIKSSPINKDQNELIKAKLASISGILATATASAKISPASLIEEIRFETTGPVLGKELIRKTLFAIIIASVFILLYVATRFNELKYGVSAILAMLHDSLVILGVFSLLGHFLGVEVDTLFVTALLTILSFSVHDTIVVYDRIRESLKRYPHATLTDLVNKAVTETLGRSINNSMTIIFMLLALWLMGGETTKWFAFALLIGTITGTYSSTFTAAPLLLVWDSLASRLRRKKS